MKASGFLNAGMRMFFVLLLVTLAMTGSMFPSVVGAEDAATYSLVVKLADSLSPDQQARVIARNGGIETSAIPALRLHIITVAAADLPLVKQNYRADTQVTSVEMNNTRKAEGVPTDRQYGVQWALPKIGWDKVFDTVVPIGSAKIALLDTGIDAAHPDLTGAVISGTSILDGSNGLNDPSGHGTMLAGIVAAVTNNDMGMAGVGYQGVNIMPVTVLNASGIGQDSDIIAGILWAADNGANVILMGFSNSDFSQNLQDALDYAWSKGVVLVAATGNDGVSTATFPAGDRGVIGVSATNPGDMLAPGSNYGQDTFLAAPGTDIYTTSPGGSYTYISGTSASSAIVAGVAGFMKAADPTLLNGVIVGRLARSADPIGTAGDPSNQAMFGNGRVNMASALADTGTAPVQPAGAAPVGSGGPFVGPYTVAGNATSVSGTVSSSVTGNPIKDATVTCTAGCTNIPPASAITNSSGSFIFDNKSIKLTFQGNGPTDITLTASMTGFTSQSQIITVSNGNSYTKNFTLMPSCTPPSISTHPASATKAVGQSVVFSVTAAGTAPLSYQWRKNGGNISGAGGGDYSISSAIVSDAGTYDVVVSNTCGSATSNAAALTVNKVTPTITWTNPADIVYGTALSTTQLNATANVPGSFTYTPAAGTMLNAASSQTLHVDFTPTDTTNYNGASKDVTIKIGQADATITVNGYSGKYDGDAHGATGTATGVKGESLDSLLHLGSSFTDVPGGTAHWTFDGNTNYRAAGGDATITITQTDATITVNGYSGKYDGNAHGATGTATGVKGESLDSLLHLGSSFTDVPGGTAHWTFDGNANYKAAGGDAAVSITQADATIAVNGYSGKYDGNAHGATGSATGVKGESLDSLLHLGESFSNVPGGTAHWTFDGNANYKAAGGDAAVSITQADATIAVNGYSGKYDGNAHGATGTATGVKGESLNSLLHLGSSFTDVPGGTAHWTFDGNTNYKEAGGDAAVSITQADATIVVNGYSGKYDGNAHGATGSATGVKGESLDSLLHLGSSFTDVPGGTVHWTFDGNANYKLVSGDVKIDISQADATIAVNGYSGKYDGNVHGATGTATGVKGESLNNLLHVGESFSNVPGGNAHWSFDGNANYKAAGGDVAVTITQADATVAVNGYSGKYDGNVHGATGTATGVKGESLNNLLHLGTSFTDVPGGTAHWTFDGNTNYKPAGGDAAVTITQAPLTATADNKTVTFGASDPIFTITYSGFKGNDAVSVIDTVPVCGVSSSHTNIGSYTINCSGGMDNNYAISYVNGTLTVNYGLGGLLSPYAYDRTYKIKSAIPIRWQFTNFLGTAVNSAAANPAVEIFGPYQNTIDATSGDPILIEDAGNSGYQYDSLTNTWQYNWKTTTQLQKPGLYYIRIKYGQTGQTVGWYPITLGK